MVSGVCRQRLCNKQLHGKVVMEESWISSHIMDYLLHMANLDKIADVNLLRMAVEYIRANPYMISNINCTKLLSLYNTHKVVTVFPYDSVDYILSSCTNSFDLRTCIPGVFISIARES